MTPCARGALGRPAAGAGVRVSALTSPVGDVAADTHLLDELGEQVVLLRRPLPALQPLVVLLVLLQALEGAAVGLPGAQGEAKWVLPSEHPYRPPGSPRPDVYSKRPSSENSAMAR